MNIPDFKTRNWQLIIAAPVAIHHPRLGAIKPGLSRTYVNKINGQTGYSVEISGYGIAFVAWSEVVLNPETHSLKEIYHIGVYHGGRWQKYRVGGIVCLMELRLDASDRIIAIEMKPDLLINEGKSFLFPCQIP